MKKHLLVTLFFLVSASMSYANTVNATPAQTTMRTMPKSQSTPTSHPNTTVGSRTPNRSADRIA